MKAFLDSNIFLNPLLAESECHDCLRVLNGWRKSGRIDEVVTSYLSMANIAYVLRKKAGKEKVAPTVQNLLNYISCISDSTGSEYEYACALSGPDVGVLTLSSRHSNIGAKLLSRPRHYGTGDNLSRRVHLPVSLRLSSPPG